MTGMIQLSALSLFFILLRYCQPNLQPNGIQMLLVLKRNDKAIIFHSTMLEEPSNAFMIHEDEKGFDKCIQDSRKKHSKINFELPTICSNCFHFSKKVTLTISHMRLCLQQTPYFWCLQNITYILWQCLSTS